MSSRSGIARDGQPRIPMADTGVLNEAQRDVYARIVAGKRGKVIGPLRVALHSPALADRWQALGEYLRFDTQLAPELSELAIICTGRFWNCQVEWAIHARIAADAGLTDEIIEAIRTAQAPRFDDPMQRQVYEFTRELLACGQVRDSIYQQLRDSAGDVALVELTAVIGYYSMVAMTLNAHDVPLPEDIAGALLDLPPGRPTINPAMLPAALD